MGFLAGYQHHPGDDNRQCFVEKRKIGLTLKA
jgi:hypothetical protein